MPIIKSASAEHKKLPKPMIHKTPKRDYDAEMISVMRDLSAILRPSGLLEQSKPAAVVENAEADVKTPLKVIDAIPDSVETKKGPVKDAEKAAFGPDPDKGVDYMRNIVEENTGTGGFLTANYASQRHNIQAYLKSLKRVPDISNAPKVLKGYDESVTLKSETHATRADITGKAPFSQSSFRQQLGIF